MNTDEAAPRYFAISCRDIVKEYAGRAVLRGVSFEVAPGRICVLAGPNGAGKSTLLKILTGQLRATSGSASIGGIDVAEKGSELRRAIGVVPENLALLDDLTIEEHLFLSGPIYGLKKQDTTARSAQLLRVLALEGGRHTPLRECSHGMRKKTALALALLHSPPVVMLDEPFEGIDPAASEVIGGLLVQMASRGVTVLLTSHILPLVTRLASDFLLLRRGEIVWNSEMGAVPGSIEELYFALVEAPACEDLPWLRSSRFSLP